MCVALIQTPQLAKPYYWRKSVAAGDMTGVKVLSFGSCTDFDNLRVEPSLLKKRNRQELSTSQLAAKRKNEVVTDIYPIGYTCLKTIPVTLESQVPIF
jgi:hypothetical protein